MFNRKSTHIFTHAYIPAFFLGVALWYLAGFSWGMWTFFNVLLSKGVNWLSGWWKSSASWLSMRTMEKSQREMR